MPLNQMNDFTFKHSDQIDQIYSVMTSTQIKENFDKQGKELRDFINALISKLNSQIDGDSGADNIKATPIQSITGNSIQEILEQLKVYIDTKANSAIESANNAMNTADGIQQDYVSKASSATQIIQGCLNLPSIDLANEFYIYDGGRECFVIEDTQIGDTALELSASNGLIVYRKQIPTIKEMTIAPNEVPEHIGQIWINKTAKTAYMAVGLTINDWKQITN
jgi:hypothetical protein